MSMRKLLFLLPMLALAVLLLAVVSSNSGVPVDPLAADQGMLEDPLLVGLGAGPPQDFECPNSAAGLDSMVPLTAIYVTDRKGSWLNAIRVPARPRSGAQEEFLGDQQLVHQAPDLKLDTTGRYVLLDVQGSKGSGGAYQFGKQVKLPRCTPHEGFLRRIHVDGPEKGLGHQGGGQPEISVTGIYDRLLSLSAILDQAYVCKICDRVKVCGPVDPQCQ